eukprot:6204675-Pleurochrysis_carterae.AAC.1
MPPKTAHNSCGGQAVEARGPYLQKRPPQSCVARSSSLMRVPQSAQRSDPESSAASILSNALCSAVQRSKGTHKFAAQRSSRSRPCSAANRLDESIAQLAAVWAGSEKALPALEARQPSVAKHALVLEASICFSWARSFLRDFYSVKPSRKNLQHSSVAIVVIGCLVPQIGSRLRANGRAVSAVCWVGYQQAARFAPAPRRANSLA